MLTLELKGSKKIYRQDNTLVTLQYYLVHAFSDTGSLYGIQIQSYLDDNLQSIHQETIPNISYSADIVYKLIQLCIRHLVTPTDLIYSFDVLMDIVLE